MATEAPPRYELVMANGSVKPWRIVDQEDGRQVASFEHADTASLTLDRLNHPVECES